MLLFTSRAQRLTLRTQAQNLVNSLPSYRSVSTCTDQEPYWQKIKPWKDITAEQFKSYRWQVRKNPSRPSRSSLTFATQLANTVPDSRKLGRFLSDVLPEKLGKAIKNPMLNKIKTKEQFIDDATAALKLAPMAVRLTPHLLSVIDWNNPLDDPIRRQFLPLASGIVPDHEKLTLDSLNEQEDSRESL